jgi:hypothetical protein
VATDYLSNNAQLIERNFATEPVGQRLEYNPRKFDNGLSCYLV